MMYSGIAFMTAAVILAAAEHIAMIVIGRVLQGIAISFASVSVPIYNSGTAWIAHCNSSTFCEPSVSQFLLKMQKKLSFALPQLQKTTLKEVPVLFASLSSLCSILACLLQRWRWDLSLDRVHFLLQISQINHPHIKLAILHIRASPCVLLIEQAKILVLWNGSFFQLLSVPAEGYTWVIFLHFAATTFARQAQSALSARPDILHSGRTSKSGSSCSHVYVTCQSVRRCSQV